MYIPSTLQKWTNWPEPRGNLQNQNAENVCDMYTVEAGAAL